MSCFEDDAVKVEKPEDEMIFSEPVDFVENPMSESTEKITVGDIPIVIPEEGKSKNNNVDMDSKNKAAEEDTSAEDTITVGDIGIVLPENGGEFKNDKGVDLSVLHKAEKDSKIGEAKSLGESKNVAKSMDSCGKNGDKDKDAKDKSVKVKKEEDKGEKKKKDKSNENDSDDKPKKEQKKSKGSEGKEDHHEEKVKEKKVKEGKKEKKDEVAKLKRKLEKIDLKMARVLVKKEDYLKRLENALERKSLDDELACKTQQWENHIQSELLSMGVSELTNKLSQADKA